jgi:hypothetical protein
MKWLEYQFLGTRFQNLCDLELRHLGAGEISLLQADSPHPVSLDVRLGDFHDRSLSREKSSPDALRRSAGVNPF